MDIGWNFRREHLRLQQRSHYVITNGGDQPNVVPSNASVWYYFREIDYPHIKELREIGDTMAKAAAMMTNTEVSWRITGAAWPQHFNKIVAETTYENIKAVGLPKWERGRHHAGQGDPEGGGAAADRAGRGDRAGCRAGPAGETTRRRVGRHRRRVVERADRDAELPVEHSRACPAITGPTRCRWRRRSPTRASRPAPRCIAMTALDFLVRLCFRQPT